MKKNDLLEIKIETMGNAGEGIGKIDGYPLFVKDALPGDTARVQLTKVKKTYAYARLEELLEASPYRTKPRCPLHRSCGGCQIQALSYEKQLEYKENKVRQDLIRIGGFSDPPVLPVLGMEEPYHYRNKAQFPFGRDREGRIVTGFSWRFYGVCTLAQADRFDGVTRVQIRVPGKQDEALDATVVEVLPDEESGLAKVTLECNTINANVLHFAQEEAEIVLATYEGIRVNKEALHIVDGERGVYVKYGSLQRFRRIEIEFEDESYLLLPADGAVGEASEVRLYDEIIVEGPNLQDGGLV